MSLAGRLIAETLRHLGPPNSRRRPRFGSLSAERRMRYLMELPCAKAAPWDASVACVSGAGHLGCHRAAAGGRWRDAETGAPKGMTGGWIRYA